jgi:propionyl-CoA carboxylase alpha chain
VKKDGIFEITDLANNSTTKINASNFDFDYGSLLRFDANGERRLIQFEETKDEVNLHFAMKGSQVEIAVYDEAQFRLKGFMAPPKKIDHAKSVLSPMPGAIVSVSVEVGQAVQEGQELLVIEAMKMQNIIKSQVEGKIKKINIKAGVSVSVDQLLIEFE